MKIYDCFMYHDEDVLLDFRLNYLNKYVDKFVIVEASHFHSGLSKKLNFKFKKFIKFQDKIIYIKVLQKPKNLLKIFNTDNDELRSHKKIINGYAWDNFQRNMISRGLKNLNDNDVIIISDLDEIPNLENINLKKIKNKLIFFRQKIFFYKFNLLYPNKFWYGSRACRKKDLKSPQWLRDIKEKQYSIFRPDIFFSKKKYNDFFFVNEGGWHFTNLKTPKKIFEKLSNYAHHLEFQKSGIKLNNIDYLIKNNKAIYNHAVDQRLNKFDGSIKLKKININTLPKYIINNIDKYKKWIF
jgi:beta-1,4-mannosyl-glycoprotein beta-1,4-N-acetylglucosaminyltransferase